MDEMSYILITYIIIIYTVTVCDGVASLGLFCDQFLVICPRIITETPH